MSRLEVLDDVGLTNKKSEVQKWLKLRYRNSNSKCICSVDCLYYLISTKLEIVIYKIHIVHQQQYMILRDLLKLLSILEYYLNLSIKRLKSEETNIREKLDDLSTKKLRTKHTVQTSHKLSLAKSLQQAVNDDLEGLREMRSATHITLNKIITDRVNITDMSTTLKFVGKRIQSSFPSDICCLHTGDYQQFIYNNILYTSELALLMQDNSKFLNQNNELQSIINKTNRTNSPKSNNNNNDDDDDDNKNDDLILYFNEFKNVNKNKNANNYNYKNKNQNQNQNVSTNYKEILNGFCDNSNIVAVTDKFNKLNDRMSDTIRDMNRYCGILQDLYHLKTKLGRQLIKFVKFNWK